MKYLRYIGQFHTDAREEYLTGLRSYAQKFWGEVDGDNQWKNENYPLHSIASERIC